MATGAYDDVDVACDIVAVSRAGGAQQPLRDAARQRQVGTGGE
jgi:hypothetical protein